MTSKYPTNDAVNAGRKISLGAWIEAAFFPSIAMGIAAFTSGIPTAQFLAAGLAALTIAQFLRIARRGTVSSFARTAAKIVNQQAWLSNLQVLLWHWGLTAIVGLILIGSALPWQAIVALVALAFAGYSTAAWRIADLEWTPRRLNNSAFFAVVALGVTTYAGFAFLESPTLAGLCIAVVTLIFWILGLFVTE